MPCLGYFKVLLRRTPKLIKFLLCSTTLGLLCTLLLLWKSVDHQNHCSVNTGNKADHSFVNDAVKPNVWIYAKKEIAMSHVSTVFYRLGFQERLPGEPWDVMWSHGYPFIQLQEDLQHLKPHQKINHFPGTSCMVSKPRLATHGFSFTPKAFRIPEEADQFLEEVKKRPGTLWVQKNNKHRGIKVVKPNEVPLRSTGVFVQEFITNPILIDGRKFDIGIYTLITSVDPLIVYIYEEEILLRFCSKNYLPFDEKDRKRYVVDDYYTPTWEISTMEPLVNKHGLTHKEALNHVLHQKGFIPSELWKNTYSMIEKVLHHCEESILKHTLTYASKRNFFEFVRFDFIIDENFRPWLMEVNLSPNLSSAHTAGNRNMYEQLVYNVLHLVGLNRGTLPGLRYNGQFESVMFVNEHDIQIPLSLCMEASCSDCKEQLCHLCKHCRSEDLEFTLKTTFLEFLSRRNFQRFIPGSFEDCPVPPEDRILTASRWSSESTRRSNELMEVWFYGKCCQFSQWCR